MPPKTPLLTVDCVAIDPDDRVLLIKRAHPPFQHAYALPGGFVELGETVEAACRREFHEETGLEAGDLELLGVFSDPSRDPRGHTATVAYLTRISAHEPHAASDAEAAEWVSDWRSLKLAFDHSEIMALAERRLRDT